ncbi:hypothetical protein [Clostridium colicanis]|jgi:hypothetical protein|uniref:DUF3784 domain-containing protein n=1 Tax=Clostridium colicanis DSM 13634 TaxID=1121305 RepID=A0A151ASI1_9CLOT|nr:hypothetical protein [Clostridium colicanis]KYH30337.1 hypothetical protein CLCOL_02830 [Clostridium colicanis DSM 13634]
MYVTSISLSYIFLGMFLIASALFLYFKSLVVKPLKKSPCKKEIIENMHSVKECRHKNSNMANLYGFWGILSLIIFIYLKFFYSFGFIRMNYLIVYLVLEIISIIFYKIKVKNPHKEK